MKKTATLIVNFPLLIYFFSPVTIVGAILSNSFSKQFLHIRVFSLLNQPASDCEGMSSVRTSNSISEKSAARVIKSLKKLSKYDTESKIDWSQLHTYFNNKISLSYKNWSATSIWADEFRNIIGTPSDESFQEIFERVLIDGNWYKAAVAAECNAGIAACNQRPWIVLVTGLNGIRKTTSIHQPWFQDILKDALGPSFPLPAEYLPSGENGFFRQLDYMIATLANEDFRELYQKASELSIAEYSREKDNIFKLYRTVAEILGVLLIRSAQQHQMNILVETSGRDIAMFDYIDHLFASGASNYQKLVVHFTIDDIKYAEKSVDERMISEMKRGSNAVASRTGDLRTDTKAIVAVNAGGPYGSEVLPSVQAESESVWSKIRDDAEGLRSDWLKASIRIFGNDDPGEWSARAIFPDGSESANVFKFEIQ